MNLSAANGHLIRALILDKTATANAPDLEGALIHLCQPMASGALESSLTSNSYRQWLEDRSTPRARKFKTTRRRLAAVVPSLRSSSDSLYNAQLASSLVTSSQLRTRHTQQTQLRQIFASAFSQCI